MKTHTFTTPLRTLFRLSTDQTQALHRLGIITVGDLLYHFPIRYSDTTSSQIITESKPGDSATFYGTIKKISLKKGWRSKTPMSEAVFADVHGGELRLIWFHQPYIAKMFTAGATVKVTGKISVYKNILSCINPTIEPSALLPIDYAESLFAHADRHNFGYPIYCETRGITSNWIYHSIEKILTKSFLEELSDPIPSHILEKFHLPTISNALLALHKPRNAQDAEAARKRFAFEEIFSIQVHHQQKRQAYANQYARTLNLPRQELGEFIGRFPFTLTESQHTAIETILHDMESTRPMMRLLEGDVGSGKTAIAAAISYAITRIRPGSQSYGNLQVAYMAPTEVLATQLFENFIKYFNGTGTAIALITGSGCRKYPSKLNPNGWTPISRAQLTKWIANGEIPIVIGTHALAQKSVRFKDLALAIVDEQHRFGIKQRMALVQKDGHVPHFLSMTATPIPRTLALSIYGDLDLSILEGMPPGRKPVVTEITAPSKREHVYVAIEKELKEGRQAYVICPRIVSPDSTIPLSEIEWDNLTPQKKQALRMKSVHEETARLKKSIFPHARIGMLHSKMSSAEKEKTMQQFLNHDIDILVATSVVEVGVNVPNATLMIIEGAERYGLAQLHQLRGRILRGTHQPYCWLFTDTQSENSIKRLKAFLSAKDGFALAELDLQLRGSGDLIGIKQWGFSDLAMEALRNLKLVTAAKEEAQILVSEDPRLENFPELAEKLARKDYEIHHE